MIKTLKALYLRATGKYEPANMDDIYHKVAKFKRINERYDEVKRQEERERARLKEMVSLYIETRPRNPAAFLRTKMPMQIHELSSYYDISCERLEDILERDQMPDAYELKMMADMAFIAPEKLLAMYDEYNAYMAQKNTSCVTDNGAGEYNIFFAEKTEATNEQ